MNLAAHVTLLKARLRDLAGKFTDPEDFEALIAAAVREYSRIRPRIVRGTVDLAVGGDEFPVTGLLGILHSPWGRTPGKPWEASPGRPPEYYVVGGALCFESALTAFDLAVWGKKFNYTGKALHSITAQASTVPETDDGLITLRALADALTDLANDQAAKPGKNGAGFSASRDETLAARANALLEQWRREIGDPPAAGGRN